MAIFHKSGDLVMRLATLEDFDDVMSINDNVHEGTDYLKQLYHSYFSDPNSRPYVLEIAGDLVGFLVYSVVDGGKAVLSQAARIKAKYMKQGFFYEFEKVCISHTKQQFPSIKEVVSSIWLDTHQYQRIIKMGGRSEILHYESVVTLQTGENGKLSSPALWQEPCVNDGCEISVRRLAGPELQNAMNKNAHLLGEYIVLNYQPHKISSPNIDYIVNSLKVVTFGSQSTDVTGNKGSENSSDLLGMSFHTHVTTKVGLVVFINYKGGSLENFEVHLRSHLQYVLQKVIQEKQAFHIYLCFGAHIPYDRVLHVAFGYGLQPGVRGIGAALVLRSITHQNMLNGSAKAGNL